MGIPFNRAATGALFGFSLLLLLGTGACRTVGFGSGGAQAPELIEKADRAFELGSFGEALELYKLASVAARNGGEEAQFVEAAAQVSAAYSMMGKGSEGVTWLAQAKQVSDSDDLASYGRVLLASALSQRDSGQSDLALQTFDHLFRNSMEHQAWGRAFQASTLASVLVAPAQRLTWCERGLQAAKASGERPWLAAAHRSIGFAYEEQGDFDTAVTELRKAVKLASAGSRERLRAEWALAHNLRLAGKDENAGRILARVIPQAKAFHAQGFSTRDAEWLGRCNEELGELLAGQSRWSPALRAMNSARQAYLLAEIQDRAPQKYKLLQARIAGLKMQRVRAQKNE